MMMNFDNLMNKCDEFNNWMILTLKFEGLANFFEYIYIFLLNSSSELLD